MFFYMMFGRRIMILLDELVEELEENESSCFKRFRYIYVIVKFVNFWKRWKNEYLVNFREFYYVKVGRLGW